EARQRRRVTARDPERAVRHDALGVGEMADHFLDAPFAAAIAIHRVGLGESAQQRRGLFELRCAYDDRIGLRYPFDVADIMRWDFIGLRTADDAGIHGFLPPSSFSAIAFTVLDSPVRMRRW